MHHTVTVVTSKLEGKVVDECNLPPKAEVPFGAVAVAAAFVFLFFL